MTTRRHPHNTVPSTPAYSDSNEAFHAAQPLDSEDAIRSKLRMERARRALLDIDDYIELN